MVFGFGKKNEEDKFPGIAGFTTFPTIGSIVLKVGNNLVVFSPSYLLGKHGGNSNEVSSKFYDLKTAPQLLELARKHITASSLKSDRVEYKEVDMGMIVGEDTLVDITPKLNQILPKEDVRGNIINILQLPKQNIPQTKLLNIILIKFNPEYGQGVDLLFRQKYGITFDVFDNIYTIITMFPGSYAPPMTDKKFWSKHALIKELK